jgi:hypothetical protein
VTASVLASISASGQPERDWGDVEGPLTYEVMADDTVAYLEGVVGGPAHLVGWSGRV